MDIKLLSKDPHSESDILSDTPIKYQLGDFKLLFPMPTYRDYSLFERGIKSLGLQVLMGVDVKNKEITDVNDEIEEMFPLSKLFDRGLGLPYFLAQFVNVDNDYTKEYLAKWQKENPNRTSNYHLDTSPGLRLTLAEWIFENINLPECMEIVNALVFLFSTIKKKALAALMKERKVKTAQPVSQATLIRLESIQRKRSQKKLSS